MLFVITLHRRKSTRHLFSMSIPKRRAGTEALGRRSQKRWRALVLYYTRRANAPSITRPSFPCSSGCSNWSSCKAAASEEAQVYVFRYVEPLSAVRMKQAASFNTPGCGVIPARRDGHRVPTSFSGVPSLLNSSIYFTTFSLSHSYSTGTQVAEALLRRRTARQPKAGGCVKPDMSFGLER